MALNFSKKTRITLTYEDNTHIIITSGIELPEETILSKESVEILKSFRPDSNIVKIDIEYEEQSEKK